MPDSPFCDEIMDIMGKRVWNTLIMARPWPHLHHQISEVWLNS